MTEWSLLKNEAGRTPWERKGFRHKLSDRCGKEQAQGSWCVCLSEAAVIGRYTCLLGKWGHYREVTHGAAITSLLDQLLVTRRAQEAGQRVLLHQGVDSLLRHFESAQGRFLQVPHCDLLCEVIDIHLWVRKQGHESTAGWREVDKTMRGRVIKGENDHFYLIGHRVRLLMVH